MDEDDVFYRALIFMGHDPRTVELDYVNLDPDAVGIRLTAYVVPYKNVKRGRGELLFRGVPILSWEDPDTLRGRAEQYRALYQHFKVEVVLFLGWDKRVPGLDEAGMYAVAPLLYEGFRRNVLERYLHLRIWGFIKP